MKFNKIGFSMMEIIIVVAIIAIISIAAISVFNPSSRIDNANVVLRAKASASLEEAIQKAIANNNELPAEIAAITTSTPTLLVTSGSASGTYYCDKLGFEIPKVNIASQIKPLLGDLPIDPSLDSASTDTGYYVFRRGNLFNVASCGGSVDCSTCTGDECLGCPTCGNGIVEYSEACDDGNTIGEGCGNGILESAGTYCNTNCTNEFTIADEWCDSDLNTTNSCEQAGTWYYTGSFVNNLAYCDKFQVACNDNCNACISSCQAP